MQISDVIGDRASELLSKLEDIDHVVTLNNVSDNKWQVILSFDLSEHNLSQLEINALNALLDNL